MIIFIHFAGPRGWGRIGPMILARFAGPRGLRWHQNLSSYSSHRFEMLEVASKPLFLVISQVWGAGVASKPLFLFISQFWGAQGASKHWSSQFWEAQGASKHLFLFSSLILGHVALLYEAWFHVYWKTITDYLIGQIGIDCPYLISNRSNHVYQSTLQWNYCV